MGSDKVYKQTTKEAQTCKAGTLGNRKILCMSFARNSLQDSQLRLYFWPNILDSMNIKTRGYHDRN